MKCIEFYPFAGWSVIFLSIALVAGRLIVMPEGPSSALSRIFMSDAPSYLLKQGALNPLMFWENGHGQGLLMRSLIHANVIHLLGNCLALFFASMLLTLFCDEFSGHKIAAKPILQFSVLVITALFAGLLFIAAGNEHTVSVGASAAILGLGAYGMYCFATLDGEVNWKNLAVANFVLLIWISLPSRHFKYSEIDHLGHLSGLFMGELARACGFPQLRS